MGSSIITPPAVSIPVPLWMRLYEQRCRGIGWSDPSHQIKIVKPGTDKSLFESNPGPQTWGMLCPYDEILLGGRRGGGKSKLLIATFAMGDHTLPEDDPAYHSYLNDRDFRGLFLREEFQNMAEFVEEAVEFFRPLGGKPTGKPTVLDFKESGARIYFNHLGDEEAFSKYKGWNITKIGIEELTQVQTLRRYLKLLGSLRSVERVRGKKVFPRLRTQIISTTNPDGPGAQWVKERFVKVRDGRGRLIPWNSPMRDPISGMTRIYIPFGLEDNPYLRENKQYRGMLMAQDEVTRKQWMDGDWDAGAGLFFSEYRPDGPIGDEEQAKYPWARHSIKSAPLKPWWFRWGSGDIGFDHPAAFHKYCRNEQDGRIHIYDEKQLRRTGSYELGVLMANWWLPELEALPDHQITLYLSPDAFNKTDATKTRAEQFEMGIKEVLGPYGAIMMRFNDDERAAMLRDPKAAAVMFERRKQESAGCMCIVIKPANNDVPGGCSYMRDLLRWRPILTETREELKTRLQSTFQQAGVEAYERELARSGDRGPEILPKVQIWEACSEFDRCLKMAQHGEAPKNEQYAKFDAQDGENGDDSLDSARYGLMAYKEVQTVIPKAYWVNERMTQAQDQHIESFGEQLTDPTRLAMIAQRQNVLYTKANAPKGGSWTPSRAATGRHIQ